MPGRGGSVSGNVTLSGQTVLLHVSLLHAATYGLTLLAVDASIYGVVGTAPAFPVLTAHVRSRFHHPPLPLVPRVQAVVFPPGDFKSPEENALATPSLGHMPSRSPLRIATSGTTSPVTLG